MSVCLHFREKFSNDTTTTDRTPHYQRLREKWSIINSLSCSAGSNADEVEGILRLFECHCLPLSHFLRSVGNREMRTVFHKLPYFGFQVFGNFGAFWPFPFS